nr:efflux RND transporter permease subunit [Armatimonas sp.]
MNLTALALRRPLTILALVIGLLLTAFVALRRMPRDVFPDLGVPTIYVAQPYGGLDPAQMDGFVTYYYEYHFLYIAGIEHVESKSIQGAALIKLQFHPGTNMAQALSETIAYVNRARAFMPAGTVPPFVTRFDAGSVPVGQLVFTSETRTVPELQDAALNKVRPLFATLPGVSAPPPFGGSARSVVIHADPERLRSYKLTPDELVGAIASANVIVPSGNLRIGSKMPLVPTNATIGAVKELESVPVRVSTTGGGPLVYVRDVATVEDGSDIQTGIGLVNGKRTVYIPVTKRADASTLSVVELVKANLGKFQSVLPDDVKVSYDFDQSSFVTGAISNLLTESLLGAFLTGLMVLLFLRDFRSALVVVLTIPLALLIALVGLWLSGQTLNLMTLGGLALAVGILVDEATVTMESVHTHLAAGESPARAARRAAAETAGPRLLALLCVLAVFIPALFMVGPTRALFTPLSLAVAFSMAASYLLSSTLVPVLSVLLLREQSRHSAPATGFVRLLETLVRLRVFLVLGYFLVCGLTLWLGLGRLGADIFPRADTHQLQLRLRAPAGTRIEKTEELALQVLSFLNQEAGKGVVEKTMGFIGVQPPSFPVNLIHLWTGGPHEAVLQAQLKGASLEPLKEKLRARIARELPGVGISFEPADIVSRVMSFGAPTPIEVALAGPTLPVTREFADLVKAELLKVSALRDVQYSQALDYPTVAVNIDRERAAALGMTAADIVRSAVPATSSSRFTTPLYWADAKSGVSYQVQVDLPIPQMNSVAALESVPVAGKNGTMALLRDVASVTSGSVPGEYARYNSQRTITLTANLAPGVDLARGAAAAQKAIKAAGMPPPKVSVAVRGQVPVLAELLESLRGGVLAALVVILLLLSASFQSVRLALVVLVTVPATLAGVALMLVLTGTTLNIQSYMGAIMAVGVAVANAILLVTFAEQARKRGLSAAQAALEGAASRLRPILMTSLAMIAGMVPMALGLGEGGAQSAPLGRAVIGGLLAATLTTLFIVPAVFALLQGRVRQRSASLDPDDPESEHFTGENETP